MHCPQCGQQPSGDGRFCRHCGFSLDEVKSLLAPQAEENTGWLNLRVGADRRSRRGMTQAAALLLLPLTAIILLVIQGVFSLGLVPFLLLSKAFFLLLMLPILRFVYAIYEAKQEQQVEVKGRIRVDTQQLDSPSQPGLLPSASTRPRIETAEVVQPLSVTEQTTKHLNEPKD